VTIRLYVDEDAQDRGLVRSLLARGVDVVTASDAGMIERPDEEHLDYATASGRALFSFNVSDFYRRSPLTPQTLQKPRKLGLHVKGAAAPVGCSCSRFPHPGWR
jgi:hypothetical protein